MAFVDSNPYKCVDIFKYGTWFLVDSFADCVISTMNTTVFHITTQVQDISWA